MTTWFEDGAIRERLEAELARQAGAEKLLITAAQLLSGGAVQQNWRLAVEVSGGTRAGAHTWVLRTDAAARLPVSLDRDAEAQVIRAAHAAGVMVAEPIAQCGGESPIGKPFLVQAWLAGTAQARRIVRDKGLAAFGDQIARDLAAELARIHSIRPPHAGLACLPVPMQSPARAEVARLRHAITKAGEPRPALEYILAWLDDRAPPAKGMTLVHGDFRTGNYMVEDGRLTGLLDWEFAHWGDPDEDIGWLTARCWRFGNDDREAGGIATKADLLAGYNSAADAKGLIKSAIRDNNPVIFLENELLYGQSFDVPDDPDFTIPIGKALVMRVGGDVTITAFSRQVGQALQAAEQLAAEGIQAEVINLRSLRPFDIDTVVGSVKKTNRLVSVEEGWPVAGIGSEIAALMMEQAFDYLDAPVLRVHGADVPLPYAANLEKLAVPQVDNIIAAVRQVCYKRAA